MWDRFLAETCFPRTRGDEPGYLAADRVHLQVFPAHAGMSPIGIECHPAATGFPRTRGDEPVRTLASLVRIGFSPHTRG